MQSKIKKNIRKIKIGIFPKTIKIGNKRYIRIVRLANEGFNIKPYKTYGFFFGEYAHVGHFFNVIINNLDNFILGLDEQYVIEPDDKNVLMKGCHCFFYKFDLNQAEKDGNLPFRTDHRENIGYLSDNELVWVSNVSSTLKPYVYETTHDLKNPYTGEVKTFWKKFGRDIDWVKMPLSLAVKRTQEHLMKSDRVEELVSQIYLTEDQIKRMWYL
jgi:hypothetical protein